MPKDMSKPLDWGATATTGSFAIGDTAFFYDVGASRNYRRLVPPQMLPEPTKSFEEIREFLDVVSKELSFYRKSSSGRRRMKKVIVEIEGDFRGLVNEWSRLGKRKSSLHDLVYRAGCNGWEAFNLGDCMQSE